jgi:hydrogenase nickel incorporation protein HypA/HybF
LRDVVHEMGIANSILEAVQKEANRYPGTRATKVGIRIGELAAIDEDSLRFCFEVLARDSELEGLQLQIEFCPRTHRCPDCDCDFIVRDYDFRCPTCRKITVQCISGDELELAFVEVEEDEPSAVATKSSQ